MANISKSFNFRNGVQVDNDNFIVNANGLVGIGTSIPTEFLDVYGTAKITGLVTTTNLAVSGVSTFYNNLKVGSAITFYPSTGAVGASTFYGSAKGLTDIYAIAVDGWYVNVGNISTTSKVGIGTTLPYYSLQVGQNPSTGNGFTVDAVTGNVNTTGIVTASLFVGSGASLTSLNATNVASGILNNARLPQNISISGIVTAYNFSGFGTDITGINASNISNGTLSNSRLSQNINTTSATLTYLYVSGVTTSVNGFSGNLSGNVYSIGLSTFSGGIAGNVTGNVNSTGLSTFSGGISGNVTGNLSGNVNSTGLSTFSGGIVGNVTGIASTARSLTGTPNIEVGIITSSSVNIAKSSGEVVLNIGNSIGVGQSASQIRFGSQKDTLDISNLATGDINYYIHSGNPGISTGNFNWLYGQNNGILMTLTYGGKLGIGITNPVNAFHVVGIATISSDLYAGGNFVSNGTITAGTGSNRITLGGSSSNIFQNTNLNNVSGITTLSQLNVTGVSSIGIGTDKPMVSLDARNRTALFGQIGINTTSVTPTVGLTVLSDIISSGSVGLGTTNIVNLGIDIYNKNITISNGVSIYNNLSRIGFNTAVVVGALDMRNANLTASLRSPFYPPILTTSERDAINGNVVTGALIYNSTSSRLELFKGSAWVGIATIA